MRLDLPSRVLRVPPGHRVRDQRRDLLPVRRHHMHGRPLDPPVHLPLDGRLGGHPRAQRQQRGPHPQPQLTALVLGRCDDHRADGGPRGRDEVLHLAPPENLGLEALDPRAGVRVGLEVGSEVGEEPVEGAARGVRGHVPHLDDEPEQLLVDALTDPLVDEPGRPAGRPALDGVHHGVAVQHEPVVRTRHDQVDGALVSAVRDDLLQHLADAGRDLLRVRAPGDGLADDGLDVGVAQDGERAAQGGRQLRGDPVGVLRLGEPGTEAAADPDGAQALPYDVLGEEVLADELAQGHAEGVLLGRDDRRVRDGQAHGVPEEGGHGEPVGERAHHAGLGGGGHVPGPGARARVGGPLRQHVHDGHEEQQPGGGELHPPHPTPPLLIGSGERGHRAVRRSGTPSGTLRARAPGPHAPTPPGTLHAHAPLTLGTTRTRTRRPRAQAPSAPRLHFPAFHKLHPVGDLLPIVLLAPGTGEASPMVPTTPAFTRAGDPPGAYGTPPSDPPAHRDAPPASGAAPPSAPP
ncbi:hypothetical protein a10_08086 [Streptomyces acidiscabies]|nr:hypothetical protein a10_08086 [Streptomyces acidiscabies]